MYISDKDKLLVPIRVGMIPITAITSDFIYACPHTRGDDPA